MIDKRETDFARITVGTPTGRDEVGGDA